MEKIDTVSFTNELRNGEKPICPECGKGKVITEHDPKTSHFFYCNNPECKFVVNIN